MRIESLEVVLEPEFREQPLDPDFEYTVPVQA